MENRLKMMLVFVILGLLSVTNALENTQTSVSKSLVECYNDVNYYDKDNKLPMNMDMLLSIIRKIEDSGYPMDLMQLSASILHRFRQDGIVQAVGLNFPNDMHGVLKFSPNGRQNDKFRVVLKYMVAPQGLFPNETLTRKERCSLHTMISSSIEEWKRGDEEKVCPVLSKYQKRISKRFAAKSAYKKIPDDVEIIQEDDSHGKKGNMVAESKPEQKPADKNLDVERFAKTKLPKSECPVESGVIKTDHGAVAAGPLLAGIAAAAQFQEIPLSKFNDDIKNDYKINNIWGATWAGDLAEAALYVNEDEDDDDKKISVGVPGGWNSTIEPKWYFLRKKTQLYMTDAEIRGGMDGLILGNLYKDVIASKYPSMKLSTLLNMYYSFVGLMGQYRACNRRAIYKQYASLDEMKKQAAAFAIALDKRVRLSISMEEETIINFAEEAAKSLEEYIPTSLNDVSCNERTYIVGENDEIYSDIIISIDFNWDFQEIKSMLAYVISDTHLTTYNGNYTIINGLDGSIVVPSTNSLLNFFNTFDNLTYYNSFQKGFNLNTAIRTTEILASEQLKNESSTGMGGGHSMLAILLPFDEPEVTTYAVRRMRDFINIFLPDLRFFIVTRGKTDKYANLVKDQVKDVIQYTPGSGNNDNVPEKLKGLMSALRGVPNRFINPKCGDKWDSSDSQDYTLTQYITPERVRFYRIHPNYFFGSGSRTIAIKTLNPNDALTVCFSRSDVNPRANKTSGTSGDVRCEQVVGKEYAYTMDNPCADKQFIHDCPPLYFSIESGKHLSEDFFTCRDDSCPHTNSIKFQITGTGLKCESAGAMFMANVFLLIGMILFKIYV